MSDDMHDGSPIASGAEAWKYFTCCFERDKSGFRAHVLSQWPTESLGTIDADYVIAISLEILARRAQARAADPDRRAFTRTGCGLLHRQITWTVKTLVRRRRRSRDRHVPSSDIPLGDVGVSDDQGIDRAEEVLARLLARLAGSVRPTLALLTENRRWALRDVLYDEVPAGLTEAEDDARRQLLTNARERLAGLVVVAAEGLLEIPEDWENPRLVDGLLAALIDRRQLTRADFDGEGGRWSSREFDAIVSQMRRRIDEESP